MYNVDGERELIAIFRPDNSPGSQLEFLPSASTLWNEHGR